MQTSNLPRCPAQLFGREAELSEFPGLLNEAPLITLLGPPGVGKSRLALHLAHQCSASGHSVWRIDLAEVQNSSGLIASLTRTLSLSDEPSDGDIGNQIGAQLAKRGKLLLLLDNFDHLTESALLLSQWLDLAPSLQLLVTTRTRLSIAAEICRHVEPLCPKAAVAMFKKRASVHQHLEFSDADSEQVQAIVTQLDCLPLAIELAAARIPALSLAELLDRLSKRSLSLSQQFKDVPSHHSNLEAAIAWSASQLSPQAQVALAQASVFRGGFTLAAAEAVLSLKATTSVAEILQNLIDHSLLRVSHPKGISAPARFDCYASIRRYASAQLESQEANELNARHSQFFVQLGEQRAADYMKPIGAKALDELEADLDNSIAVYERQREVAPSIACRAILAVMQVVRVRRLHKSHAHLFDGALQCALAAHDDDLAAKAYWTRASVLLNSGDLNAAIPDLEQVVKLASTIDNSELEANALIGLGAIRFRSASQWRGAQPAWQRAFEIYKEDGDEVSCANALANLALFFLESAEIDAAEKRCSEALRLLEAAGVTHRKSFPLIVWAAIAQEQGDLESSRSRFQEAITTSREIHKHRGHEAEALTHLGILECEAENWDEAKRILEDAVRLYEALAEPAELAVALGFLAVAVAHDDRPASQALLKRCEPLMDKLGSRDSDVLFRRLSELAAGTSPPPDPPFDLAPSHLVRVAGRLQERSTRKLETTLHVGQQARWFRIGCGPKVDLQRRRILRRLLTQLIEHRTAAPGVPVSPQELIANCWSGESIDPSAATNRLYVAMSKLRKLGLDKALTTDADGYLLDPAFVIQWALGPVE